MPSDKEAILDVLDTLDKEEENLSYGFFFKVVLAIVFILLITIPKIMIATQIYYKSLEISRLQAIKHSLAEENIYLQQNVERQKFELFVVQKM